MKWLLDTNVVSETAKPAPDRKVVAWMAVRAPDHLALSLITVAELQAGVFQIENSQKRTNYVRWLEAEVVDSFQTRILPVTLEILIDWLALARRVQKRGTSRSAPDLLIASTARVHNLILVSRNVKDFAGTGVVLYDPWTGKTHVMDAM